MPLEFWERLAAMTPRPETNLLICHGVLAPRARWRRRVVAYGHVAPDPTSASGSAAALAPAPDGAGEQTKLRAWRWVRHRRTGVSKLWEPSAPDRHPP